MFMFMKCKEKYFVAIFIKNAVYDTKGFNSHDVKIFKSNAL